MGEFEAIDDAFLRLIAFGPWPGSSRCVVHRDGKGGSGTILAL